MVLAGDRVTYLQSSNGWARALSPPIGTGWISEAYLAKTAVAKLQPDTIGGQCRGEIRYGATFSAYGGVRPGSVGHSSGRATDLMIKDYKSAQGIKNGNEIARFLIANRESLGISYLIWQDRIWLGPARGWEEYSKSGRYGQQFANNWNDTTKHLDHIHAETYGELRDRGIAGQLNPKVCSTNRGGIPGHPARVFSSRMMADWISRLRMLRLMGRPAISMP